MFYGNVEPHVFQKIYAVQKGFKRLELFGGHRQLGVDALMSHVDTAENVEFIPVQEQKVSKGFGIFELMVLVKRKGKAFFPSLLDKLFPFL